MRHPACGSRPVHPVRPPDGGVELPVGEGLEEEPVGHRVPGLLKYGLFVVPRYVDEGDVGLADQEVADSKPFEPAMELQFHQNEIGPPFPDTGNRLLGIGGRAADLVSQRLQLLAEEAAEIEVILDEEDPFRGGAWQIPI